MRTSISAFGRARRCQFHLQIIARKRHSALSSVTAESVRPTMRSPERAILVRRQFAQYAVALLAHRHRHLLRRFRRRRARPFRVGEHMQIGERHRRDESAALFELGVGLARETPPSHPRRWRRPASAPAPSSPGPHNGAVDTCDACGAACGRSRSAEARARGARCAAMRPSGPNRSSEKSIGSTELSRSRSTGVSASSSRTRSASRIGCPVPCPSVPD